MSNLIELSNLSKYYGKKPALQNVSLTLESGKIIGLLGPNGSGKTTLIKILNGLLKDIQGEVLIQGQKPGPSTKAIVSYLPDDDYFSDWMKAEDAIHLFKEFYSDFDENKAASLLERLSIDPKQRIKTMSKGQKEKFQLSLVMSRNALVYVFDEPIGGVDPAAREVILDIILNNYSEESLVLISTHLITDIEKIFD
ncbi:MAG: ABC transporter ATP-binding protein, partial [Erysipelotrichaceae bacterium]|nr:ABC transporter ATP-binding protein [Erysipelotrichaceae bacterium]